MTAEPFRMAQALNLASAMVKALGLVGQVEVIDRQRNRMAATFVGSPSPDDMIIEVTIRAADELVELTELSPEGRGGE